MRLLFFTDTHIRGTTPRNRKDNFYETLKTKFLEIKNIIETYGIDYVLHGGDWFDRPDISPSIVREFAVIIKEFNRPIISLAGNHDMYGHNPGTIGRTMLGLLEGIGILKLLDENEDAIIEENGIKVQITGYPYNYEIDGEQFRKYYVTDKRKDVRFSINMIHGMLLKKPFFEGMRYTLLEDIKDTQADITLTGHYHSGFGIRSIDGKYFVNPGSLVRITNTIGELNRKPKVVLIELTDNIRIEEIELKSALPGEEVLDREQLEASQDRSLKLHNFYQNITASGEYKKVNLADIIEEIASNNSIKEIVKNEAIKRISIARENLSSGEEE